jgi:hypothetical protein
MPAKAAHQHRRVPARVLSARRDGQQPRRRQAGGDGAVQCPGLTQHFVGRGLLVPAQNHNLPAAVAGGGQPVNGRGDAAGHPAACHDPGAAAQCPLDPRECFGRRPPPLELHSLNNRMPAPFLTTQYRARQAPRSVTDIKDNSPIPLT